MEKCKYCELSFLNFKTSEKANHSRWCDKNPKRSEYVDGLKTSRKFLTDDVRKKQSESLKNFYSSNDVDFTERSNKCIETKIKNGTTKHSEESKNKIRVAALNSNHRRLVRSIREYVKKDGSIVKLDSSWEEHLAKRLDFLNIDWIRPEEPIYYFDRGVRKRYFPDFYLPFFDLYLDPKNPIAYKVQENKIKILLTTLPNLVIIKDLQGCLNFTPDQIYLKEI